ncbi:MAG: CBS domain-containing protein [Acidobacteriota bacterium]
MKVIRIAQVPPPTVEVTATVMDAVVAMQNARGGATAVLDGEKLAGIFSERDVMLRVVGRRRNPEETAVGEVMTPTVRTVIEGAEAGDALELMISQHIRHLPIVNEAGRLVGLISIRNLLHHHVEDLVDQLNSLEAYFSADGPGG